MNIAIVSLKEYSSLHVGGVGKVVTVTSVEETKEALLYAKENDLIPHIIGQGTNSYFGEELSQFLFIYLSLKGVMVYPCEERYVLKASASEIWDDIVALSVEKGLCGIENLSYIPGTVGAAPVQNIGAYGAELRDVFMSCEVVDTRDMSVKTLYSYDCHFGYRDSVFKHEKSRYIILSVSLLLSENAPFTLTYAPLTALKDNSNLTLTEIRNAVIEVRKSKLPDWKEHPNCGSFFKNPVVSCLVAEEIRTKYEKAPLIEHGVDFKVPAAWLIEHVAEMKGVKIGNVRTWDKQPLVIVNDGNATADEIDSFKEEIQKRIQEKVGIALEQEVNRIG